MAVIKHHSIQKGAAWVLPVWKLGRQPEIQTIWCTVDGRDSREALEEEGTRLGRVTLGLEGLLRQKKGGKANGAVPEKWRLQPEK